MEGEWVGGMGGGGIMYNVHVHCAVSVYSNEKKDGLGMKMCEFFLYPVKKRSIYLCCLLKGSRKRK
jgi:hypothetical protein